MLAVRLRRRVSRLRLGKGRVEAQLLFDDGSCLHFRQDRHTSWVQRGNKTGVAPKAEAIAAFRLDGRGLALSFHDGSRLFVWRLAWLTLSRAE